MRQARSPGDGIGRAVDGERNGEWPEDDLCACNAPAAERQRRGEAAIHGSTRDKATECRRPHRERHQQLATADRVGATEALRRDPNHGEGATVERDFLPNDAAVTAKTPLPQSVTDHRDRSRADGPFLVWHPSKYAELLAEKMTKHNALVWLVNTGWGGGGPGVGKRISLKNTRAIIDAIHDCSLAKAKTSWSKRLSPTAGFGSNSPRSRRAAIAIPTALPTP